jgi:alkanesulfonate monooxygenase SsuD/methylene tetrahydromethanopterin reductase-like flavin-dependent oxidoreductase (luciferase family)
VRTRKVMEAVRLIRHVWSHDPPYRLAGEFRTLELANAIMPELGVGYLPKPFQAGGPPISISLASPFSPSARTAAQEGWGIISANIIPTYSVASHWRVYGKACAEAGVTPSGENWRVARNVMVAPTDAEARDRVYADAASNRYFFTYIREVLHKVGALALLKPQPDMPDEQATPEAITEACVIHGSPRTVLEKLVAFRDQVGPFGTLLMTGLDWGARGVAGAPPPRRGGRGIGARLQRSSIRVKINPVSTEPTPMIAPHAPTNTASVSIGTELWTIMAKMLRASLTISVRARNVPRPMPMAR